MSELILRCYRKSKGERRAEFDVYYLFEANEWGGDNALSKFEIEELDGEKLDVTCEYQSNSKRYGVWVYKKRGLKFSVQAMKNSERNDDPVICYLNDHGQTYTFLLMFKKDLIEYFENKET